MKSEFIFVIIIRKISDFLSRKFSELVVIQGRFEERVIFCLCRMFNKASYAKLVPNVYAVNTNFYDQRLRHIYAILKARYSVSVNRRHAPLQYDNASVHTTGVSTCET